MWTKPLLEAVNLGYALSGETAEMSKYELNFLNDDQPALSLIFSLIEAAISTKTGPQGMGPIIGLGAKGPNLQDIDTLISTSDRWVLLQFTFGCWL